MAFSTLRALLLLIFSVQIYAALLDSPKYSIDRRQNGPASLNDTDTAVLQQAQQLIAAAVKQQGEYNAYRIANPRRNQYTTREDGTARKRHKRDPDSAPKPPVLDDGLLEAAALIAEHDAALQVANGTLAPILKRASSSYWVPQVQGANGGLAPMGSNSSYQVFRDVTAFGAKGDGVTDDTKAINAAIASGGNCGANCLSSSIKGTLIYFPAGTYLISSPINAFYYSQLVGDATNLPTIRTSASFIGLGAIQTDVYIDNGNGAEWYINQSNFYRQVRNFVIDIKATTTPNVAGLHWQVAQATSLVNVRIYCSTATGDGNTQMGMFTENGSGGFMSDVSIWNGAYGIYGGNQQYTVRDFTISGQTKACICLIWDWGWTWSGLLLNNAPVGISLINPQDPNGQVAGSTYIMDSTFSRLGKGIYSAFNKTILDSSVVVLDNVQVVQTSPMFAFNDNTYLDLGQGDLDFYILGSVQQQGALYGIYNNTVHARPAGLTSGNALVRNTYFTKSRPQYSDIATSNILNVKKYGAVGDGVHDDTQAIQSVLAYASTSNLIYFPAGTYVITSTLSVKAQTRMTGSVWSQLAAKGPAFEDMSHPTPMLQVGSPGDTGTVEMSDLLFTAIGNLPGLVMVEWNVAASSQGSVGMWDCHFRLGGAIGTQLQVSQCPLRHAWQLPNCVAANLMLHLTPQSNGYFENVWAWVADHDIDDVNNTMVAVTAARGILVESTGPTWLWGSASEHSQLYQYNFANSKDTFAGMIQTESPYYQGQPTGHSPGIWAYAVGQFAKDPNYYDGTCTAGDDLCLASWAVMIQGTTNLTISGAGLYSWFANFGQDCVDSQNCQQRLAYDDGSSSFFQLYNLITVGATEMLSSPLGGSVLAKPNTQSIGHPYWSILAAYMDSSEADVMSCEEDPYSDADPPAGCIDEPMCDWSLQFQSIAALNASLGSFPEDCADYYAIDVFRNVIAGVLANYSDVNNGYDHEFGYYQEYMNDVIPGVVQEFMKDSQPTPDGGWDTGGPGNAYFDCIFTKDGTTQKMQCPVPGSLSVAKGDFTLEYVLRDANGFYGTLQSQYGINSTWIVFNNWTDSVGVGPGCHDKHALGKCDPQIYTYKNRPQATSNINVPNPKDIISAALTNVTSITNSLLGAQVDILMGQWNGTAGDIGQVYSTPAFLMESALEAMAKAKDIGAKQEKEDKIRLILTILSAIFAFLPFLDSIAPEVAGLTGIFTAVSLAGGVGEAIYEIRDDPSSAPLVIFETLLGGYGRLGSDVAALAKARRALSETQKDSAGKLFATRDKEYQDTIAKRCMG